MPLTRSIKFMSPIFPHWTPDAQGSQHSPDGLQVIRESPISTILSRPTLVAEEQSIARQQSPRTAFVRCQSDLGTMCTALVFEITASWTDRSPEL
jgi:hypothetical protein